MTHTPALWSAQAHIPSVLGRQIVIAEGDGSYVTTAAGQRLFDGTAGLWHTSIGHGREEMAQVAYDQMKKLETYHVFGRYLNDQAVELSEKLVELAPIADAKVILNSGGSDSIDVACKLARRYWTLVGKPEKTFIISREHAYHGLHAYGTSVAGLDFNREGFGTESLVPDTIRVEKHDLAALEAEILRVGPGRIAAYIAEPVMGTGGVHAPQDGYFEGVKRLCREHDILFIADEVITGFGRTGEMFASTRYDLQPDIVTFAKGVTSGYAQLGGIFVAPRLWQPFFEAGSNTPIYRHGTTYSGHATSSALALKNLEILEQENLVARAGSLELTLAGLLAEIGTHEHVVETRVGGFLGGIELVPSLSAEAITDQVLELGFITRPLRANTIQISPPFIATEQELGDLVSAIRSVLDAH
ncbi:MULTISPECIES: aspartate aminotransferase family protein [unclassified Leucobacter]|uniref:aminotransferase family protein n=1 Tax=unclassified Leucobacter TaxID=2621730 RepID=UPI00165D7773|nr:MULTISPECIES: aminotransferase class III-fold pyridoxal phosphate-dependent enzyme [unclassified Leucobacter]MBC9927999.1 aspartate aminotransferase family protein [Leucobacter sp. cx-169]MBC9935544.1 aspartate aminotransferase family protein [Leucobacter sp. cx-87]